MTTSEFCHSNQPARIAVIGFSNAAYRTAQRLAESGAAVLFVVSSSDLFQTDTLATGIRLISLPCLHAGCLPADISACSSAVVASDDEQFNLHVTMQLSSDFPELKIITRLFNLGLGREIETRMPQVTVMSVSEHAAPFFAVAAFQNCVYEAWREDGQLMARSGDQKSALPVIAGPPQTSRTFESGLTGFSGRLRPDLMLVSVLAVIVFVIAAGTVFFWLRLGIPLGDALYFVVTTLTTTGYGDYSLREYPFYAKLAGMTLMLSGASLFAILFALLTDKLFRMRLELVMGRRQVRAAGHVIVCGAGDVGVRIVECLKLTGAGIVVVERDQEGRFNQRIREMGIPLIIDDATLEETLERAAARSASAIICATDNDMRNLEVALNARSLNPSIRTVVRVYDRDFADQMQQNFHIEAALSSSAIASRAFAEAALEAC
jgi:voltage-gated potassium channel Kch